MKVLDKIRLVLKQTKELGHDSISINAFEDYLSSIEKENDAESKYSDMKLERDLAIFSAENDRNIAHASNLTARSLELFKSVIQVGQSALKASMLINGGAAVALLAFMGKIWGTSTSSEVAGSISMAIFLFCIGIFLSALASGITYLSQTLHSIEKANVANRLNVITIFLVLGSYSIFIYSSYVVAKSFGVQFGS